MIFLAFRHLLSRRQQTLFTLLGVALGTSVLIAFTSVMTGFQDFLIDQLVNNDAHVRIQVDDRPVDPTTLKQSLWSPDERIVWVNRPTSALVVNSIRNPLGWFEVLNEDSRVYAYAPQLSAQVLYAKGGIQQGGRLTGVKPEMQVKVTNILSYVTQGDFSALAHGGRRIVIGEGLAERLGLALGDNVMVGTGRGVSVPMKIAALVKTGVRTIDDGMGFSLLSDAQQIAGRPGQVTDIAIKLFDVAQAQEFAHQYAALSTERVASWDELNANILSVFGMQNLIRGFISAAIMLVASFGIYNILSILVNQKRKEIGILRSMGFTAADVQKLFLVQGTVLGSLGGLLGLVLGYLMGFLFSLIRVEGMVTASMVSFSPWIYVMGFAVAFGSALFSSFFPARAAARFRPIEIIRSGE
jgi:lipoprotein-releasing system permease protein